MDNVCLVHWDYVFSLLAKRFKAEHPPQEGQRLYMVANIDGLAPIDITGWPFFYAADDHAARSFFEATWPTTRHLVFLDLTKPPYSCWKEI